MTALTFTLKINPAQRIDLAPLSTHLIKGLSVNEINKIALISGNRKLRVDEIFNVSGTDTQQIIFKNSCAKLDSIGREMESGNVTVKGDAGGYLGIMMKGGGIKVTGNTELFTACEMNNGEIIIEGNVGDFLGGALPGNKNGMRGGTVIVKGNVGQRLGDHMRRGIILVEGSAGDYCGSRMVAGTIAVMGDTGKYLGYAMQRGSILLWRQPKLGPTFNDCGTHTFSFLRLLFSSFKGLDSKFARQDAVFGRARRYGGDVSGLGKGEILVKA